MKYTQKSFSVGPVKAYRDNWDAVFGKKPPIVATEEPVETVASPSLAASYIFRVADCAPRG